MKNDVKTGRIIFGIAITGLGLVHWIFPGFRPVFLPVPSPREFTALPVIFGLSLVMAGWGIIFSKYRDLIAGFLAVELTLFLLIGHLPNRLRFHPGILGVWTDAIKLFALIGGALLVAHHALVNKGQPGVKVIRHIAPVGIYFFAVMLILFGLDHFFYTALVSALIPGWIPFKIGWTYFTGVALMGSGIFIALNLWRQQIGLLLALMLFLWLVLLHLPASFSQPDNLVVNIVSSLESLAFAGSALLCTKQQETNTI